MLRHSQSPLVTHPCDFLLGRSTSCLGLMYPQRQHAAHQGQTTSADREQQIHVNVPFQPSSRPQVAGGCLLVFVLYIDST